MMKNSIGQLTLIFLLMAVIFLQIEGVIPDIFAGDEELIELSSINEGLEFYAIYDGKSFTEKEELIISVAITNKSSKPIDYYAGTTLYGIRGVIGAKLASLDGISEFTDKFTIDTAGGCSDTQVLDGELLPGKTIYCDIIMLPYSLEEGVRKAVDEGEYMLKLSYSKNAQEIIEAEFPITVIKRFGRISLKTHPL